MAILYNPNDETNKISNLRKAVYHMVESGSKNPLIIGDYNTNLNKDLDYVNYSKNPHQASREFLHGLKEDSVFINVFRFLYSYNLSNTWKAHNSQNRSRIDLALANQNQGKETHLEPSGYL